MLVVAAAGGDDSRHLVDREVLDALGERLPGEHRPRLGGGRDGEPSPRWRERRLAGAGLDVYADEPHVPAALLDRDDVVLLPHVGSATSSHAPPWWSSSSTTCGSFLADGTLVTPVST